MTGPLDRLKDVFKLQLKSPYHDIQLHTKSLFIHIPKTGGNSVTQMLYNLPAVKVRAHIPARDYLAFSPDIYAQCYVFATVRHPYARLNSAYRFLRQGGMTRKDAAWANKNLARYDSFAAFMAGMKRDAIRKRVLRYTHFKPQAWYLCDANGVRIVPHLVHMEDFETEMQQVCRDLGKSFRPIHENRTKGEAAGRADPELEDVCFDIYRKDYELLGYERLSAR